MCRKKIFVVFLTCIFLFAGLGMGPVFAEKMEFALITKNLVNPGWLVMKAAGKDAAKDLGLKLTYYAPMKPDNVLEQISIMENLIQRKVACIVVVPADSKGIIPGIEKANRAGIPVVTSNTKAFGGKIVSHVGATNYEGAYASAKYLIDKLGGKGKVIILEGTPGSETGMVRKKGFDDAIKKSPGISVLTSQTARFQRKEGMRVMENLLERFPKVDGLMCANDEMALGAVQAIKASRRTGEMKIAAFDGVVDDAIEAVAREEILVTIDQNTIAQAYWAVVAGYVHIKGNALVPEYIPVPSVVITKGNVKDWLVSRGKNVEKWLKERKLN
jgi:ribose transport system substrate-binding protein